MHWRTNLCLICLFLFYVGDAFSAPKTNDSLPIQPVLLPEILVKRSTTGFRLHGDTISYDGKKWMDPGVLKLEDLLKKIPGFQVEENGRILYNGREISRILLDGEDLTGMRYNLLSRNVRAALVDSIQVIGQYHENRLMKGFVQSDETALNIRIGNAFKNRISGSAALSRSFAHHGKGEFDLSRIHRSSKHLFFVNRNNTGEPGVIEQTRGPVQQAVEDPDKRIGSWPFAPIDDPVFVALPNVYKKMNRDNTALYLAGFSVGRFSKLQVNAHGLSAYLSRLSSRFNEVDLKDQLPLDIYSRFDRCQNQLGGGIGFQLDVDRKQKRVSVVKLDLVATTTKSRHSEERFSTQYNQLQTRDTLKTVLVQVEHQETWLLKKQHLLVLKNKLALDHNMQHLTATGYPGAWFMGVQPEPMYKQALLHKGARASSDLVLMKGTHTWKAHLGWRNQFDGIHSAAHDHQLIRGFFRSYVHTFLQHQHSKRWGFELHAAAGTVVAGTHFVHRIVYPVFQVEPAIRWTRRVMEEVRISYLVSRKTPDLHAFHAGPVLMVDGGLHYGSDQFILPQHTAVQVELRKTDLYRGFTGFFVGRLSAVKNEMAFSSTINAVFEKTSFFLRPTSNMIFLSGGAEKFFHTLHISYKVNFSFNALQAIQQVNDLNAYNNMNTVVVDHRIRTRWKGAFQWEWFQVYSGNRLASSSFVSEASAVRQQYGLVQHINLAKIFHANLQGSVIRFGKGNCFPLLDVAVRSSINRNWKASLTLINLANRVHFRANTAGVLGMGFQEIQLNGRRILVGLQWGF